MDKLLTAQEVADLLQVSESKAYALMKTEIPTIKLGRSVRVRKESLEKYLRDIEANPVL